MFIGDLEHFGLFNYNYLGRSSLLNGAIVDVKTILICLERSRANLAVI